ncbi:hypothetical protein ACF5W4_11190 [Bacillota bacterium Lsc_1132]
MTFIEAVRQLWRRLVKAIRKIAKGLAAWLRKIRPKKLQGAYKEARSSKIAEAIADQETEATTIERPGAGRWQRKLADHKADMEAHRLQKERQAIEAEVERLESVLRVTKNS